MKSPNLTKTTLLLTSMMTMMTGAVVAPSLPQIKNIFQDMPNVDLLTKLVITLPALFIALFSPIYGYFIDKAGRVKLLLAALCLYAISGTSGFYLNNLYLILVGRAFFGISVAGIMTIATTLAGDYFKGEERVSFLGTQASFMSFGGVFFIIIAGWFADIQWQMPFLIYGFSLPVIILAAIFLFEPRVDLSDKYISQSDSVNIIYPRMLLMFIYGISFLAIVFFYMIPVQIPFLVKKLAGISNFMIGFALSITMLTAAIVSINYKTIKNNLSFPQIYFIAFILLAAGFTSISYSSLYYHYLGSLVISGIGVGLLMPSGNLWIMKLAPPKLRGRLIGRGSTALFLGMFCSPIIAQPVISAYSPEIAFRLAGLFLFLLATMFFVFRRKLA